MPIRASRPPRALPAIACVLLVGLAGCGDAAVETAELESTITKQFAAQGVRITDVTCKDGTEAKVGAPVACTALNPFGTKLVLEGRITAIKDDEKASFRVKAVRGIAKGPTVASQARGLLEQRVGQAAKTMECPAEVPIPTTPVVTCALTTSDGKVYDTRIKIDANSKIDVRVADRPR